MLVAVTMAEQKGLSNDNSGDGRAEAPLCKRGCCSRSNTTGKTAVLERQQTAVAAMGGEPGGGALMARRLRDLGVAAAATNSGAHERREGRLVVVMQYRHRSGW
jgi:hypothetical protein